MSAGRRAGLAAALVALFIATGAGAADATLSGTWRLDAKASQSIAEEGGEYNDAINAERREAEAKKFRDNRPSGGSRFQAQADAAERMIREDARSNEWFDDPDLLAIGDATTIRIYQARRIAILYDGERRRLLTVNPAGRAFSYSGGEVTDDEFGHTLTYIEDGDIVIETGLLIGGRIIERYSLTEDPQRMRQHLTFRQGSALPPLELERFYDRVE